MPVDLLRADATLAERIEFSGAGVLRTTDNEWGLFAQDHWALSNQLALDLGLRFSGQTIGQQAALAPRVELGQPLVCRGQQYGFPVDVVVAFTPDPEWVCQQITAGVEIPKALEESLYREPVYNRSNCESVQRAL